MDTNASDVGRTRCSWLACGRAALIVGAVLAFAMIAASPASAADWPQYRGINRDGISAETGWLKSWPPTEVWRQTVGMAYSSVAVSEGRIYTMGWTENFDTVFCFDAQDGTELWTYTYANGALKGWGPGASPRVDGGQVYTYSHTGDLYCFDKVSGAVLWSEVVDPGRHDEWGYSGSPLIEGDLVILNAAGGVAVDKNAPHDVVWSNTGTGGFGSPTVCTYNSQRIIMMTTLSFPHGPAYDSGSCGMDALTGEYLPGWDFGGGCGEDPQYYGADTFYCGSGLYQFGAGQLTSIWNNNEMGTAYTTCVVVGDYAYGYGGGGSTLKCQDLSDGSIEWSQPGMEEGALMASDGKLVCLNGDGLLVICKADPAGFDTEGRSPCQLTFEPYAGASASGPRACPALANGLLYVRSYGSYHEIDYVPQDQYAALLCLRFGASEFAIVDPTDGTVDAPITVTIEARDENGVLETGFQQDVTLVVSGSATGGGLVDIVDGTGTIDISNTVAETVTLTLDDTEFTGRSLSSTTVAFGHGAPADLVFTAQPADTCAGLPVSPDVEVTVRDQYGNTCTDATDPVTVAIGANPAGGVLSGTLTVDATNGVAAFSDLSIDVAAAGYDLTADSGSLGGAQSAAFEVMPDPATALAFTVQPSDAGAEMPMGSVEVTVRDVNGDVVPSDGYLVTIAIGANPGGGAILGTATVSSTAGVATFANLAIDRVGTGYDLVATCGALTSAPSDAFAILQPPVSGMTASGASETDLAVMWTNPSNADFAGVVVFMREGAAPTFVPVDGVSYTSGTTYGDAECVLVGTASSFVDIGHLTQTHCFYAAYAFTDAATPVYSTVASADATTLSTAVGGSGGGGISCLPAGSAGTHVGGSWLTLYLVALCMATTNAASRRRRWDRAIGSVVHHGVAGT